eukprot:COSAG04_NODE_24658_length_318_cov_1.511416_1_plen_52_part_10
MARSVAEFNTPANIEMWKVKFAKEFDCQPSEVELTVDEGDDHELNPRALGVD